MHAHIRRALSARLGAEGLKTRILYGGSVNATSAARILSLPDVGGALVGRASLDVDDFEAIVWSASPGGLALPAGGQ